MRQSGASWFSLKYKKSNDVLENLTNYKLREWLLVYETIIKRLYTRNRELEQQLTQIQVLEKPVLTEQTFNLASTKRNEE